MNINFKIIICGNSEWKQSVELRESILRKPFGMSFSTEELLEERDHLHVAGFLNDQIVASAVIVPEQKIMKMQRVVVQEDLRNKEIGSKMMTFCEQVVSANDCKLIYCHARDTAVKFYLKNEYVIKGGYFNEDGIPHLKMYKVLANKNRARESKC